MRGKYVYPAVFAPDPSGGSFTVTFPDLKNCYTCGDDLADAIEMAEDVLALTLYQYEKEGWAIPTPSALEKVATAEGEFVTYIFADTFEYRRIYSNKAIKKTLTIPEWMNEAAVKANLNFSQILQEALLKKLNISS